jgi:hypothetical protein
LPTRHEALGFIPSSRKERKKRIPPTNTRKEERRNEGMKERRKEGRNKERRKERKRKEGRKSTYNTFNQGGERPVYCIIVL